MKTGAAAAMKAAPVPLSQASDAVKKVGWICFPGTYKKDLYSRVTGGDAGEVLAQGGVPYGWLHLKLSVFKELSDRGVDADLLFRIAGENPKRFFTECQRKEP